MKTFKFSQLTLNLALGDITDVHADCIVNAANSWLLDGAGVTGAIFSRADKAFRLASEKAGYCPTGRAICLESGVPSWPHVMHAVGPIWEQRRTGQCRALTAQLYEQIFEIAERRKFKTLAFPSLGTGVYNVPVDMAAEMFFRAMIAFNEAPGFQEVQEISVVLYDLTTYHTYKSIAQDFLDSGSYDKPERLLSTAKLRANVAQGTWDYQDYGEETSAIEEAETLETRPIRSSFSWRKQ